jgi:single-stranded-DNA-specific exonuclease
MRADTRVAAPPPEVPRAPRSWRIRSCDQQAVRTLSEGLDVSPLIATLLSHRGVSDAETAGTWLSASLRDLPNPMAMVAMTSAVDRIVAAIDAGESIWVHGDYDVDGCTSTVLLVEFLTSVGGKVSWYAPHRERDGYGIQPATMRRLAEQGAQLVITCDNGTSANEAIAVGNDLGVDTVVVDHHKLPEELPAAAAILNPQQDGEGNPYLELAAVGVAFMLAIAIRARLREMGRFVAIPEPDLRPYLDIVALGTVADVAPLRGVNRLLVRTGLKVLGARGRPGLRALLTAAGIREEQIPVASDLGFRLGPRINAAGRLDEAARAVELLLSSDPEAAIACAKQLDQCNRKRQDVQRETFADVLRQAARDGDFMERRGLVLWSEDWHPGVVGIVASKVAQHFHRPAIVVSLRGGVGTGSGRAIKGIDLFSVLSRQSHLLERFGGHRAAAGLSIKEEMLPALRLAFAQEAFTEYDDELWQGRVSVDAELHLRDITWDLHSSLRSLEPFGVGNPEPVFLCRGVQAVGVRTMAKDGLRMTLCSDDAPRQQAIGFGLGVRPDQLDGPVDVLFALQENTWAGRTSLQMFLKEVRPTQRVP